jgi:hypothetical protein
VHVRAPPSTRVASRCASGPVHQQPVQPVYSECMVRLWKGQPECLRVVLYACIVSITCGKMSCFWGSSIWRNIHPCAGKSAAAVRFAALTALHSMFCKRLPDVDLTPLLEPELQLVPLLVQSMDEDWYVDTRKLACCTMVAFITACGSRFSDDLRRQMYPELNKRMDDSDNEVRIAASAAMKAFAIHGIKEDYCDTNSGCVVVHCITVHVTSQHSHDLHALWSQLHCQPHEFIVDAWSRSAQFYFACRYLVAGLIIHLDDSSACVQEAVHAALLEIKRKKPLVVAAEVRKVYEQFRSKYLLDQLLAGL